MGCRSRLGHLTVSLFENDSILENATIKTRIEQTRDRICGRFDDWLTHAIERRVEQDRHARLLVKLPDQIVKSAIVLARQRLQSTCTVDVHDRRYRVSLFRLNVHDSQHERAFVRRAVELKPV